MADNIPRTMLSESDEIKWPVTMLTDDITKCDKVEYEYMQKLVIPLAMIELSGELYVYAECCAFPWDAKLLNKWLDHEEKCVISKDDLTTQEIIKKYENLNFVTKKQFNKLLLKKENIKLHATYYNFLKDKTDLNMNIILNIIDDLICIEEGKDVREGLKILEEIAKSVPRIIM